MGLSFDGDYLKSFPGILKLVEFVCLIIAFALMLVFQEDIPSHKDSWKFEFFIAAHIVSAVIIIPVIILHLLKWTALTVVFLIEKKLGKSKWNAILFVIHLLLAIICVASSGIMADKAKDLDDNLAFNKFFPTDWNYLISAVVFGFLSFVLLLVDAILFIRKIAD